MNTTARILVTLVALAASAAVRAAVPATVVQGMPGLISYQGTLVDPTGTNYVDGIYTLDIRLWSSENGTSSAECLWGAQYSAFVKGGAFTLVLGDPNAQDLQANDGPLPTYKRAELWKAMWGANTADFVRYLGVTPHQNARGATLTALAEIAPRQRLGATPFVFRAERAQYAEGAQDFTVGRNLAIDTTTTLAGGITAPNAGTQQFGPLKVTAREVQVAGAKTPSKNLGNIWSVANLVNLASYGEMRIQPSAGDVLFNIASGHALNVTGPGLFVSETPRNVIGGTGETKLGGGYLKMITTGGKISFEQSANTIGVYNGNALTVKAANVTVDTSDTANLHGNPASLCSRGSAKLSTSKSNVLGKGKLRWRKGGVEYPLFVSVSMSCTLEKKSQDGRFDIDYDTSKRSQYNWTIVGFNAYDTKSWRGRVPAALYCDGEKIYWRKHDACNDQHKCDVRLIGVLKELGQW